MNLRPLALTALLTSAATTATAANLVVNGSFEAAPQAAGTFGIFPSIAGWVGDPDIEVRNDYDGIAFDGLNFVELDTFANSTMTQTITGTGLVRLTFHFSTRGTPSVPAGSNGIAFSLGSLSGTVLEDVPGASAHDWQQFTGLADLGSSGSAVLRFSAIGVSDQLGGSLDDISVTPVPLPGAWVLMMSGVGLIAARRPRRR